MKMGWFVFGAIAFIFLSGIVLVLSAASAGDIPGDQVPSYIEVELIHYILAVIIAVIIDEYIIRHSDLSSELKTWRDFKVAIMYIFGIVILSFLFGICMNSQQFSSTTLYQYISK
jgi:membrane protease YdiL (CAAX protease family)